MDAKVVGRIEESLSEQAETFEFETLNKKLKLTTYHSLPYYRDDKLIEDSVSTLEVGDKVISVDSDLMFISNEIKTLIPITKKFGLCVPTNERQMVKVDGIHSRGNDGDYYID